MSKLVKVAILSVPFVLAGCKGENGTVQPITQLAETEVVATVNGRLISKDRLELLTTEVSKQARGAQIPKEKLIEELINRELLLQEAENKNLDQQPAVANRLEFAKRAILYQAAVQEFIKIDPVSEIDAKKEYDLRAAAMRSTQFKARHILLKSEDDAKGIIKQLEEDADFAELAKNNSTGPTGPKGGDLGWFNPKQMVPEFTQAVIQLQNGEYSKLPVKTKFGWHVILREDSRDAEPPSFEQIKERIVAVLQQQKLVSHINSLKTTAEIVVKDKVPATTDTGSSKE